MFNSSYLDKKIDDVLATSNGLLSNLDHCPMMKSVDKRMEKFETLIEKRMRKAVEDAKKDCSEKNDNTGLVFIYDIRFLFACRAMGREFCKIKTGFKKVKKADSARAESPGILNFFS